jgi:hypothetical protein
MEGDGWQKNTHERNQQERSWVGRRENGNLLSPLPCPLPLVPLRSCEVRGLLALGCCCVLLPPFPELARAHQQHSSSTYSKMRLVGWLAVSVARFARVMMGGWWPFEPGVRKQSSKQTETKRGRRQPWRQEIGEARGRRRFRLPARAHLAVSVATIRFPLGTAVVGIGGPLACLPFQPQQFIPPCSFPALLGVVTGSAAHATEAAAAPRSAAGPGRRRMRGPRRRSRR